MHVHIYAKNALWISNSEYKQREQEGELGERLGVDLDELDQSFGSQSDNPADQTEN